MKTKDDLVITGGTYSITAKGDALSGNDSVKIADGTIDLKTTEGDGIKSNKDDDETKGFVSIDGGKLTVDAADKGIKAAQYLRIAGGTIDITAGDDALHSDVSASVHDGTVTIDSGDDALHVEYTLDVNGGTVDVKKCVEGFEGQVININGGTSNIVASDDAVNASIPNEIKAAKEAATTGENASDDAAANSADSTGASDEASSASSGASSASVPSASGESAHSGQSAASDGEKSAASAGSATAAETSERASGKSSASSADSASSDSAASDRGGFPGGGEGRGGMGGHGGGMGGGMMSNVDASCAINVAGGTLTIETEGDGIDSNGYFTMSGGEVYVSGPTSSGNGALDYELGATVTGGTLIAAGSSGMAANFTDGTQGFALVQASGSAGDTITVTDASGKELASHKATKDFQCVVVTAEGMADGETYTLKVNDTATEFTATTEGSQGGFGGMGGMHGQHPGGQGGQRPDGEGWQRPDGENGPGGHRHDGQRPEGAYGPHGDTDGNQQGQGAGEAASGSSASAPSADALGSKEGTTQT